MTHLANFAVLLMAYGTPSSNSDIEGYLTDIRRGRNPSQETVEGLTKRYSTIGGSSPLLDITNAQALALEKALNAHGMAVRVYVGMKHWHPYIGEVLPQIVNDGFRRIVALALAPHYSQISIGGYKQALNQASVNTGGVQVDLVESWYDHPLFIDAVAKRVNDALADFPKPEKVEVLFTAHSLPERILQQNDPYPSQLHRSCQAVADVVKLERWSFAYQSAGETGEAWLGPDILDALRDSGMYRKGSDVLIVPIGFVADHLEILYDIDVEAQEVAKSCGLNLRRTKSLNTSPTLIEALADIVLKRAKVDGWS